MDTIAEQIEHQEHEGWLDGSLITFESLEDADEYSAYLWEIEAGDPDLAYERHLENLGWEDAERDRQMEARF